MTLTFVSLYSISLLIPYLQEQAFYFTHPMQPILNIDSLTPQAWGHILIEYKAILQGKANCAQFTVIMKSQKSYIIKV